MTFMRSGKVTVQVRMSEDEHAAIHGEARDRGVTLSDLIRYRLGLPVHWGTLLQAQGVERHIRDGEDADTALCGMRGTVADVTLHAFRKLVEQTRAKRYAGRRVSMAWNICITCRKQAYLEIGIDRFPGVREARALRARRAA